jgi:hypothetical protein
VSDVDTVAEIGRYDRVGDVDVSDAAADADAGSVAVACDFGAVDVHLAAEVHHVNASAVVVLDFAPVDLQVVRLASSWKRVNTFRLLKVLHPDHLVLDRSPNIGPLISRWELDKFNNC